MDNLLKYKKISLADFIINQYGFYKAPGSSRNNPKLTNGDMTVVVNKKETYYYFDVHNPENKGTIIDFIKNIDGEQNIGKIIKSLENYLSNDIKETDFTIEGNFEKDIRKQIASLKNEGNADYLTNRGISLETIKSKQFSNVIKFKETPYFTDIAFLMQSDIPGIQSISYRGKRLNTENGTDFNFKGLEGYRSQCLLTSFSEKNKPFDKVFIAESFIDCLSYYELNSKKLNTLNCVFISTEGSIQPYQTHLLSNIIQNNEIKEVKFISDNDHYGSQFAAFAMCKMRFSNNLKKSENNYMLNLFEVNVAMVGKKSDNAYISFKYPEKFNSTNVFAYITDKVNKFNSNLKENLKFNVKNNPDNELLITFPNYEVSWKECFKLINDIKFCSSKLFIKETAKLKDFNEDLQEEQKKTKEVIKKPLTSKFQKYSLDKKKINL